MPIDIFANQNRSSKIFNAKFLELRDSASFSPARGIIRELQQEFVDLDGNFVEQLQTTAFDSRLFELYIFAMLREAGHELDRTENRPDFLIKKDGIVAAVEVVTANPPNRKEKIKISEIARTRKQRNDYLVNTVAIRLGSPLYSKLNMKYWELPHVGEMPLVLAIQDHHAVDSFMVSSAALVRYLYGMGQRPHYDACGRLTPVKHPIAEHKDGNKRIPSNFFGLPNAERISAVLFCNVGTADKFNRIGHQGEHRAPNMAIVHSGTCLGRDSNSIAPDVFAYEVGGSDWETESWAQGTVLLRNPNALHPLPKGWLGAPVEQNLVDEKLEAYLQGGFHLYRSHTDILMGPNATTEEVLKHLKHRLRVLCSKNPGSEPRRSV
ncbi:hypothetical protein KME70_14580 [Ralstonia solanacearum]|nr:hypothetical protein KME70_14580 [Ralstonia solanacearum]